MTISVTWSWMYSEALDPETAKMKEKSSVNARGHYCWKLQLGSQCGHDNRKHV